MVDIGVAGTDIDDGIIFRLPAVIFHPAVALRTDPGTAADDDLLREMIESEYRKRQNRVVVCDIADGILRDFGIGEEIDVLHAGLGDLMPEGEGGEHGLPTVQEILIEGETAVLRAVVLDIFLLRHLACILMHLEGRISLMVQDQHGHHEDDAREDHEGQGERGLHGEGGAAWCQKKCIQFFLVFRCPVMVPGV